MGRAMVVGVIAVAAGGGCGGSTHTTSSSRPATASASASSGASSSAPAPSAKPLADTAQGLRTYLTEVQPLAASGLLEDPAFNRAIAQLSGLPANSQTSRATTSRVLATIGSENAAIAARLSAVGPPPSLRSAHVALIGFFRSRAGWENAAATTLQHSSSESFQQLVASAHVHESYAGRAEWIRAVAARLRAEHVTAPAWLARWVALYR